MSTTPVSVQLYTVRNALESDLLGALGRLAQLGFKEVEAYDFVRRPRELAEGLARHGLGCRVAHVDLVGDDVDLAAVTAAARELGVTTLVHAWVEPELWRDPEFVMSFARGLNEANHTLADQGFTVGYHNHWFELENQIGGRPSLEAFADALDDPVVLEVDTYWVKTGGADPADLIRRLGERVAHLHLKDGPATMEKLDQVALGSGVMDVPAILAAAPDATRVLELDDFRGDVFEALSDGLAYLATLDS